MKYEQWKEEFDKTWNNMQEAEGFPVSLVLAKLMPITDAIVLSFIMHVHNESVIHQSDGWYPIGSEMMKDKLGLSINEQNYHLKRLKKQGIIKTKNNDNPTKRLIYIHTDNLLAFVEGRKQWKI